MAWVRLLADDEVTDEVRAVFDVGREHYDQVLHAWRAIAHCPDAFVAYLPYLRAVVGPGHVDQRIKDLTAIRVGLLNGCRYSVSHRVASARRIGVDEADILGVADPGAHAYDDETAAALAFADELTTRPITTSRADEAQAVSAPVLVRVEALFDDAQRAELALAVSLWNALARFHRVMDLDLDMPEPPEQLDAALRG